MQELLGRLRQLDPTASASLRVIACFDELMAGGVGTDGLLSAAAALSGAVVGVRRAEDAPEIRIDTRGERLAPAPPTGIVRESEGMTVWIEAATSEPGPNEAIIIERLALALHVRYDHLDAPMKRDVAVIVGHDAAAEERVAAARRRGLADGVSYRVVVAPLFALWRAHPRGPEDVVASAVGPVHVAIVAADAAPAAEPLGIGIAADLNDLELSFRTALVALRLAEPGGVSRADDLGGLAEVLADTPANARPDRDEAAVARLVDGHTWASATLDALVRAGSVREAARLAGIHHSTMTTRVSVIADELGFAPLDGLGRARLAIAVMRQRMRASRALELPPPVAVDAGRRLPA
ncbi:PucR family transcriptional regulator [Microbacterium thalassium]|uniref:PucR family transcriptional regulator n=1 Tax=Microbacterium thalassium TaxID=362649 RepID=A0A7X0FSF5_9MICO|nr:PucR family transcriptional regulator [Microbacterium thalassium]MBB6392878.1 hypothetical protein [Microbacterium thalassium]GLK22891.1 hypothetical protein GCM10017607_02090 [Microbacterium thalassium]